MLSLSQLLSRFRAPSVAPVRNPFVIHQPANNPPPQQGSAGPFECLDRSSNRAPINPATFDQYRLSESIRQARDWMESAQREEIAAMARHILDNYSAPFLAVGTVADYSAPVIPRSNAADAEWAAAADAYFDNWAERADSTGRFTFAELQRPVSITSDTDGDVGISMERLPSDDLAMRIWPAWRIGEGMFNRANPDGVIRNRADMVTGYRIMTGPQTWQTYGPDEFLLLFEPDLIERFRGISTMRRGLNDLRDASEIKGFLKLSTKIESALPAVVKGANPFRSQDWDDPEAAQNAALRESLKSRPNVTVAQMLGGEIPMIDGELQQLQSLSPGPNKIEFLTVLAAGFFAGMGIPAAFLQDEKLGGPAQRAILGKAQKRFDRRKQMLGRLARWVWVRVIADAVDRGLLPSNEQQFLVSLQTPSKAVIDLGDQAKANKEAVESGLMSRARYHGDNGNEWRDELDQVLLEDEYLLTQLKAQAERLDVPFKVLLQRHGFVSKFISTGLQEAGKKEEPPQSEPEEPKK